MATQRRMSAAREARRPWWIFTALVVLLVVDVLLVVLALQSTAPRSPAPGVTPPGSDGQVQGAPDATPTAPVPAEAGSDEAVTAVPPTRLLTALDDEVAWRSATGDCPDTAVAPELTTDGGLSWKSTDLSRTTEVLALQRIVVSSADTASFIGVGGADCSPSLARTFVAGDDFAESPDLLDDSWHLAAVGSAAVHSPSGDATTPCDGVLLVAPLDDDRAAILCDDASVLATDDSGATWTALEDVPGAVALTGAEDRYLVALARQPGCAGLQLVIAGAEEPRTDVGCVESPLEPSELAAATAIDWNPDALWVWVDDRLLISTDGGITW
jgi:hypothetical protein